MDAIKIGFSGIGLFANLHGPEKFLIKSHFDTIVNMQMPPAAALGYAAGLPLSGRNAKLQNRDCLVCDGFCHRGK